ncbi:unnamed protein product [Phytomonas sp. Hart1]|nr:unnamed protein product [Phytomonas sp. Hart1]|eukprot:CCW67945.1 unnamed protein product [Phytomonas sp. isolate Hart1]
MGSVLPKPILSKVVERSGNSFVNSASASMNGFRYTMEDAHMNCIEENIAYFGIFDGHSNEKCSQYVAESLPAKLKSLKEPITAEMLESVCVQIDKAFLERHNNGGSTGTFCILRKNGQLTIANVGDSRILVVRKGTIIFETEDHKPFDPTERARIERCGGFVTGNRVEGDLAVSRAFGDAMFKEVGGKNHRDQKVIAVPDVSEVNCQQGDLVVICCDGVFEGNFTNVNVARFVGEQMTKCWDDLAVIACRVCDEAIRRGSRDNISCLIVHLAEGTSKVRKFGAKSFVPGPPFARNHEGCYTAYVNMAKLANLTCSEALQKRYMLLQMHDRKMLGNQPPVMRTAFEVSDDVDLDTERSFFGRGPAPGNENAFFAALAQWSG